MSVDLVLSERARSDIESFLDFLAERNPVAAAKLSAAIENSLDLLVANPHMGYRQRRGLGRIYIVPRHRYVIYYRVSGDTLEVLQVFHPAQDRSAS